MTFAVCALAGLGALCALPVQAQWLDNKTPGIPRTAEGHPDLSAPLPRTTDGKPDLTGIWRTESSTQEPPKLQPWAEAVAKNRMEDLRRDSPETLCLPGPIASLGVGKVVQTPGLLLMLYGGTLYRELSSTAASFRKIPIPIGWATRSAGGMTTRSLWRVLASMTERGSAETVFPVRNVCISMNESAVPTSGTWRSGQRTECLLQGISALPQDYLSICRATK